MPMRVYLPATLPLLAATLAGGSARELPPGPAYAVTPGLNEYYAEADTDELEYIAMSQAALASIGLLAADPEAPRRRVVIAADVEPTEVVPAPATTRSARGLIRVGRPIPIRLVAAVHVDGDEAIAAVSRAAADLDDDFAAGEAEDHPLLWYASQEIDGLLAECRRD
jgi:hypothetical protein